MQATLQNVVESYHSQLNDIDARRHELGLEQNRLLQQRALAKAAAIGELGGIMKLPEDVIGQLAAACW